MLVPQSAPLPTNSQTPMSAQRIARAQRYLAKIDRAEKLARFGVLGFCKSGVMTPGLSLNTIADIAQHPMTPVPNGTSSSLVSSSGSGVLDTSPNLAPPSPTVIPITGSGAGVPNDPYHPPLTLQLRRPKDRTTCPLDAIRYAVPASGDEAPGWGDRFTALEVQQQNADSGIVGWFKANPVLAAVGLFAGALLVSGGMKGKGR